MDKTPDVDLPLPLDVADIQGNILRGYRMPNARHFALTIANSGGARAFIAALVSKADGIPQITTAAEWVERPSHCLNLGITCAGLAMLGIPNATLALFPQSFVNGPASRAADLGDVDASAPANWIVGGPANPPLHLLVSLYTDETREACLESLTAALRALFAKHGLSEAACIEAKALPDDMVHFGYRDGIAQPRIKGAPGEQRPDKQRACEPGEFLLGENYTNQFGGNFLGNLPEVLCGNATYAAFRVMQQHVKLFEAFIELCARRWGFDKEFIAAKLMGRWRNGNPLLLTPTEAAPEKPIPDEEINDFDYMPGPGHQAHFDDAPGIRCPIGSHIRRLNPRGAVVMGMRSSRRILRRAMPYGPQFVPPANPLDLAQHDPVERGLVGFFICGDLESQFEFLLRTWANKDFSTTGIQQTRDPILGAQPPEGGQFVLRTNDARDPIVLDNLPRLVDTRGSAYCLLPGIRGLKFLAGV